MNTVTELILAKIQETAGKMTDHEQRSALGMARSWVKNGKLDTWNPERHKDMIRCVARDQLATDLVEIMAASNTSSDEQVQALAAARAQVNAPYFDPSMMGAQNREANLKPKEREKGDGKR